MNKLKEVQIRMMKVANKKKRPQEHKTTFNVIETVKSKDGTETFTLTEGSRGGYILTHEYMDDGMPIRVHGETTMRSWREMVAELGCSDAHPHQ